MAMRTTGLDELTEYLTRIRLGINDIAEGVTREVAIAAQEAARVAINPREGPRPPVGGVSTQPGTLAASIQHVGPFLNAGIASSYVGTELVYSRIQEKGGKITANGHCGGDGKYLRFRSHFNGKWATVQSVTIPAKHYMEKGAAIAESQIDEIATGVMTEFLGR